MPERIFVQSFGIAEMAKRQKTNNNPHGSKDAGTDISNPAKQPGDSKGSMLTPATPPNMNIVDISDTISDVEDEEISSDHTADTTTKKRKTKKCRSTRERRKVKHLKHKLKVQSDSAKDSKSDSDDKLFHKDAHKQHDSGPGVSGENT